MKLACIDNHILIWGVRKHATPGQEAMLDMTAAFLAWLDRQKIKVVVPAPVLYEFLNNSPKASVCCAPSKRNASRSKNRITKVTMSIGAHVSR